MADLGNLILRGTRAAQPAAGIPGRVYFVTDEGVLELDNGATWDDISSTGSGMTNPMTTAGDVIYGGASGVPTRLAKGTASQVLAMNAGATAPEWVASAGSGRTLITELTPTGTGTASFTSIPGTYKKLTIEFAIRATDAVVAEDFKINLNTDTTDANYRSIFMSAHTAGTVAGFGATNRNFGDMALGASAPANNFSIGKIEIIQYANTNFYKVATLTSGGRKSSTSMALYTASVEWNNTAAITQIDLLLATGNYATNSVLRLYGES